MSVIVHSPDGGSFDEGLYKFLRTYFGKHKVHKMDESDPGVFSTVLIDEGDFEALKNLVPGTYSVHLHYESPPDPVEVKESQRHFKDSNIRGNFADRAKMESVTSELAGRMALAGHNGLQAIKGPIEFVAPYVLPGIFVVATASTIAVAIAYVDKIKELIPNRAQQNMQDILELQGYRPEGYIEPVPTSEEDVFSPSL